jgi:hypothetical protein
MIYNKTNSMMRICFLLVALFCSTCLQAQEYKSYPMWNPSLTISVGGGQPGVKLYGVPVVQQEAVLIK